MAGAATRRPSTASATGAAAVAGSTAIPTSAAGRVRAYARQDASYSRPQGERFDRPAPRSSGDPWSEVPPELEEQLRAQLAQSPKARRPERAPATSRIEAAGLAGEIETMTETPLDELVETAAPKRRTSTRKKAADQATDATAPSTEEAPAEAATPKRRTSTRKKAAETTAADGAMDSAAAAQAVEVATAAPKGRTTTRKKADVGAPAEAAATAGESAAETVAATAAPKRRTTRKKAEPA